MLGYLAANGIAPWMDVARVEREIAGRYELSPDTTNAGQRDLAQLRLAGLVRRIRIRVEGRDRYPFTITPEGQAALAAPVPPDDRQQQTDLLGFGYNLF